MSYSALHNHTDFSVLDGFSKPEEYLELASKLRLNAFAVTEHGNQYSWVYFDELKQKYPDLKMIYGVELYECFDIGIQDPKNKYFHLIALAKNEQGRIALNEIITKSNFDGFYYKPRVDLNMLKPYADNLIILSACLASKLAREPDYDKCVSYINEYKKIFPHFYLEMQSHSTDTQEEYNKKILQLSVDTNTEFAITTDSHVAKKEDLVYQARHIQIARDEDTLTELYDDCYLQSEDEIHAIMDRQIGKQNVDIGLENTNKIADMIDVVNMPFQEPQLPTYPLPEGFNDNCSYLRYLTGLGWKKRKFDELSVEEQKVRRERLEYELGIIHQMHYDGYFLIVWDFVDYAKKNRIVVGDGRGSGGSSIVNYLLGITELDPIKYNLIFERFLNPERVSMPDIDVDFADRDKIVEYLTNKYGSDRVCQVINFSYITPIVAIKDVGRVLEIPYNICDKISKKFTYDTFEECIENNPTLNEEYIDYKELFDIASKISGRVRNASIHAGGVGIVDTKITDYMGMKIGSKGEKVIQVDKKKIESIGIIKFDVLGVATLNIVQDVINDLHLDPFEFSASNPEFLNDTKMYELLQSARTNGVFQVESQGMKDLLLRLQPTSLEDVSAVLALYRPDSMGALDDYIDRKHGKKPIEYIHPDMKPILDSTYGCLIYQEQLMDIVRKFGGRTYGGADLFRKAIGKKDKELIRTESEKLYHEIIDNNYSEPLSKEISNDLKKKGGYLFNKSHSALYSILTLKTAYQKAHYTAYFFKALLNLNKTDYGALNKYIIDAREFGVEVLPPHMNKSDLDFTVKDGKILFGLGAIKGLGEKTIDIILNERQANGEFKSFNDFYERINPSNTIVIALTKAGAIPCNNKKKFLINYASKQFEKKEYSNVTSLPKLSILKDKFNIDTDVIKSKEDRLALYNQARRIDFYVQQEKKYQEEMQKFYDKYLQDEQFWEFDALSVFITNNPFVEAYKYIKLPFDEVDEGGKGIIVGIISNVQKKKDRRGKQFAFVWINSAYGLVEVICWHTQYKQYEDLIKRGNQVTMLCKKSNDKPIVSEIKTYQQWLEDRRLTKLM